MIIPDILELKSPENPLPFVFDSPHSGDIYPDHFKYDCVFEDLKRTEDKYVDDLFSAAPDHGAPLLSALFPRSMIDLNRARDDIDPELYNEPWPYDDELPTNPTNRSLAGIGLIRRLATANSPIYNQKLSPKYIKSLIDTCYDPYHQKLEELLDHAYKQHGKVYHINCHSMPSSALTSGALGRINPVSTPHFVLGDRDGTTCDIGFTHALRNFITSLGYKVAINDPYKGVELVERYSDPARNRHSIQIEINRALYMDEKTFKKSKNYKKLKEDITKLIEFSLKL
jgi:N-formylglutamate amidohydrolase